MLVSRSWFALKVVAGEWFWQGKKVGVEGKPCTVALQVRIWRTTCFTGHAGKIALELGRHEHERICSCRDDSRFFFLLTHTRAAGTKATEVKKDMCSMLGKCRCVQ